MSRVLLFVDRGDGPKCRKQFGPFDLARAQAYFNRVRANYPATPVWLIECDNAEAGRAIITHDFLKRTSIGKAFADVPPVVKSRDPQRVGRPVSGRILAASTPAGPGEGGKA